MSYTKEQEILNTIWLIENDDPTATVEKRIMVLKYLMTSKLGEYPAKKIMEGLRWENLSDIHPFIEHLMGRPVWTHEFAFPETLYRELKDNKKWAGLTENLKELRKKMPVIVVKT